MSDPPGNSPSKCHQLFSSKSSYIGKNKVISSMNSIWEDGHIQRPENNQRKCLWCDVIFQGINSTKALARVIGTRSMHINDRESFAPICQYHLSRYKDPKIIKAVNKGIINNYLYKMISSISRLKDKSSEVVESNIQRNSRCMSS